MNLQQIIDKFLADVKYTVSPDDAVIWANEALLNVYNLDIPLFEKRDTLDTTSGTYAYDITDIADDIRKVKWVRYRSENNTVLTDYNNTDQYEFVYLRFTSNDTQIFFRDDPCGQTLDVCYYRNPAAIDEINDTVDLPARWRRAIYLEMMQMAQEQKMELPSGDWFQISENFKEKMMKNERTEDRGAKTVTYYNLLTE